VLYGYPTTTLRRYEGLGYAQLLKAYFLVPSSAQKEDESLSGRAHYTMSGVWAGRRPIGGSWPIVGTQARS